MPMYSLKCLPGAGLNQGRRKAWTEMKDAYLGLQCTGLFSNKSQTAAVPENDYKRCYSNITQGFGGQDTAEEKKSSTINSSLAVLS